MARPKVKKHMIQTDKGNHIISSTTLDDLKNYMKKNNLYGTTQKINITASTAKDVETAPHITPAAKLALKYDDSKISETGLIYQKMEDINIDPLSILDQKRDEVLEELKDF